MKIGSMNIENALMCTGEFCAVGRKEIGNFNRHIYNIRNKF
jgi:hypothetical protein